MTGRTLFLLLALPAGVFAADVVVRIAPVPAASGCLSHATIIALDVDGGEETRVVVPDGARSATVVVKDGHPVLIRVSAPGCWSETAELTTPHEGDVILALRPVAHLQSAFEPGRVKFPASIEATAFPLPASGERAQLPASGHRLDCSYADGKWDCLGPADLPFDLRLTTPGLAPIYYWGVIARAGEVRSLEPRALHPGGSLSGWVEGPDGKPLEGARLLLAPAATASGEEGHALPREVFARTNRRGFFQLTGIADGEYRLVSRVEGFSPVLLPVVNIRDGESLTWPRAIRHLPWAALEVRLDPPVDSDGKPWTIELEERIPLAREATPPLRHAASLEGIWRAERLRADDYRAVVKDRSDAILERFDVDLSKGATTTIPLSIHRIMTRGVLRVGDAPLEAEIRFTQQSGRSVSAKTNSLGEFDAAFPRPGSWTPTIYPHGPDGARIRAKSINVPEATETPASIEITLPGGRIQGTVVDAKGSEERAAVHVMRDGRLVAQQMTDDDGKFDFIGIDEGSYAIDGEGRSGTAPGRPAHVTKGETTEVKLQLEPVHEVSAIVMTPNGAPASGAVVRVSADGGESWTLLFTDVEGRFEYSSPRRGPLQVIVMTQLYPALVAQLRQESSTPATLVLQPRGGKLRLRSRGYVGRGGTLASLNMYFLPGSPFGLYEGAAYLEPGVYTVCAEHVLDGRCRQVTINPLTEQTVDPRPTEEATP